MTRLPTSFLLAISLGLAQSAAAGSWSYRGTLEADGEPAEGRYDLRFTLYDSAQGGRALAVPVTVADVTVHGGELLARPDFGDALEAAGSAWLGVEVAARGEAFEALPERQAVASKALAAGVCWDTTGNAGNVEGTNFLGNSDNVPLDLRVDNKRVARFTRGASTTNVVLGATNNSIDVGLVEATISGGGVDGASPSPNVVHGRGGTIGGGSGNQAGTSPAGTFATVGGGLLNNATGQVSTIGGGNTNAAAGSSATIAGGTFNEAAGNYATVAGGFGNTATGYGSAVPGGENNLANGNYSFAGGWGGYVRGSNVTANPEGDQGSFVWADTSTGGASFGTTGPNQFLVRALGGIAFNGKPNSAAVEFSLYGNNFGSPNVDLYLQPGGANFGYLFVVNGTQQSDTNWILYHSNANGTFTPRLQVNPSGFLGINRGGSAISTPIVVGTSGTTGNGANLTGGGTWTNGSSRTFKQDFAPIDAENVLDGVLALPIYTWNYKESDEGRHLGPVAEDFKAAFGLGGDERYIATVDESGVALAAIQGLAHRLEAEQAANQALAARVAELEARLAHGSE